MLVILYCTEKLCKQRREGHQVGLEPGSRSVNGSMFTSEGLSNEFPVGQGDFSSRYNSFALSANVRYG